MARQFTRRAVYDQGFKAGYALGQSHALKEQIRRIPGGSFVVIMTDRPDFQIEPWPENVMVEWRAKQLKGGVILPKGFEIQCLDHNSLKLLGLQRLHKCEKSETKCL